MSGQTLRRLRAESPWTAGDLEAGGVLPGAGGRVWATSQHRGIQTLVAMGE
jgi:hypothetical protein